MSNVSHIFQQRAQGPADDGHRWTECEARVADAVAYFENGCVKYGIATLAHALVTNDRPDPVTLRRLFREIEQAAKVWKV